ncbi:MAG: 23S rRNA (adenine(2030)-N(6))-methyltransferase RlmJ [Methylophilaceae bacterium]
MLSYRHAFHAGNHADILKHYTLSIVLDYFNQKDKPYSVIDTHAGAGMYSLADDFSQKNMEFETGISRLLSAQTLPKPLTQFVAMVQSFSQAEKLNFYPGSPKVSEYFLRANDQLRLFELHPNDYKILVNNFKGESTLVKVEMQNGFVGIKACLPPPSKRGVVIIDPPYEDKQDYQYVVQSIKESLKRFATGTYIIWYPLIPKQEPEKMINALRQLKVNSWLNVSLNITKPLGNGYGMFGSGLFIINPPWILPSVLEESLPILTKLLGQDSNASYQIESEIR